MLYRCKISRTGLKHGMLFAAAVFAFAQEAPAATTTTTVAPLIISGRQSVRPAGTYSAGIADVIRMLDAQVEAQVILAYIQNSPIPFDPEATELIALKEHGGSTELLMALLHHGDELRLQLAQAQSAVNPPTAAAAYDYAPEMAYPAYPYGYPDSSYAPYPATYYSYAYGWPLAYGSFVGISRCRPYRYPWFPHGRFSALHREGNHADDADRRSWASAAPPPWHAAPSVFATSSGHTGTVAAHSNGSRGLSRSSERSGGRR